MLGNTLKVQHMVSSALSVPHIHEMSEKHLSKEP